MRYQVVLLLSLLSICCSCRRSVYRPSSATLPEITTCWSDEPESRYRLKNSHLEPYIFEVYDQDYLHAHQLPAHVPMRNNVTQTLDTAPLIADLQDAVYHLLTVNKKTKKLDNFVILKQTDYNYFKHTGLIVLKHKKHPFVIKLFMESPENFVKPFTRGIEECAFFVMGGGMNRYLAGFTRIANRNEIDKRIQSNRYWRNVLDTPRKWFWCPHDSRTIDIVGKHIGDQPQHVRLPAMYAIICDEIRSDHGFSLLSKRDRRMTVAISQFVGIGVDPHINNFMIEKGTNKIVIIDTEHFPTLIGIKDDFQINDFITYYSGLFFRFMRKKLTYDKKSRLELQTRPKKPLFCYI